MVQVVEEIKIKRYGVHHVGPNTPRTIQPPTIPLFFGAQDPTEVIDRYGADALRLYLINSPVVRAETLKFSEEGVKSVIKDVFLPWYNAYRFLGQNVLRLKLVSGVDFAPNSVRC